MSGHPLQGQPISADWARGLERRVTRHRVRAGHGLRSTETPNGTIISLAQQQPPQPRSAPRGFPYGPEFSFGITVSGPNVTVHPGTVQASGLFFTAPETVITITGTGQYIGLEINRLLGTLSVTGPHTTRPVSSGDAWRTALYVFSLEGEGDAQIARMDSCKLTDIRLEVAL